MTTRIRLTVPPAVERSLIRQARKVYPIEMFAYLLGTIAGDSITIDDVWFPENLKEHSGPNSVTPQPEWAIEAHEQAREDGLTIVGWSHSHPATREEGDLLRDRSQSEGDLDCGIRLSVSGVVVVQDVGKKKRRLRASLRFWGPTIQVEAVTKKL